MENTEHKPLKVDRTKLYTQSAYARKIKVTPSAITKMIESNRVETVKIEGAVLIYVP